MNPDQWDRCTDPGPMLEYLVSASDPRLLRLFACACMRRVWDLLDYHGRRAVDAAERHADGELPCVFLCSKPRPNWVMPRDCQGIRDPRVAAQCVSADARRAARTRPVDAIKPGTDREKTAQADQADLLRCLFGSFFIPRMNRPLSVRVKLPPSVRQWNGGSIVKLAELIYRDQQFDALPVLADMLEEAGVTDRWALAHCRGPGPHARGCHVLDAILQKRP
jgi:hypothetical protein